MAALWLFWHPAARAGQTDRLFTRPRGYRARRRVYGLLGAGGTVFFVVYPPPPPAGETKTGNTPQNPSTVKVRVAGVVVSLRVLVPLG